ncbi:LamG domain-containing protein [Streptomyces sp. LP05-1]|uniref:LamG domain-containing protein n=1 Tax=Streptomyces pyxinae TaxID=2970734 RepID=A0ABT2CKB1_9ACTN|nr:LamG-like jellyroll fold domain-containing protein [Streptomyces sp. LP05-1]MCS0637856.1 LamG domain-containing protein [Streptomyces sp. LP05-1]
MRVRWVRSPRLFPPGRSGRRRARATALSVLVTFSFVLSTETAAATGATLPALSMPRLSLSELLDFGGDAAPDTPDQEGGTAGGKSHTASADATSADGGSGREPGKGKGELDPYQRPVDKPPTATTAAAPGTAASFDSDTSERDARKSTATSDYYVNADGSTTVRHFTGRANFKAGDGTWKPIDTRLTEDADGRFQQRANSLDVEFAPDAADRQLASVDFGSGRSLAYALRGAAGAEPAVAADGTVTYPGVLPATDLQLVPLAEGFKENIVLRSRDAANSWLFPLDAKGLTPRIADDGDVEFTAADGTVTATIPHAYMTDAKTDPRSTDPVQSRAVSYELTTADGKPALRLTADRAWLDAPERVYPVTVDPTVTASNSTYAQNTIAGDHSTENILKVGSYDSGTNQAVSFLQFPSLGTTLKGQRVTAAKLNMYAIWSATCTAMPFSVHPIVKTWTPSGVKSYPGPAFDPTAIGTASAAPGASCSNADGSTDVGVKMPVTLGTDWFDYLAAGGANNGLALSAPVNDGLHWKKFHSDNSATAAWRPALELTYSPNTKPQVNAQYPPENFQANTLQPELLVYASDADKGPSPLGYTFEVYDADSDSTTPVVSSGATPLTKSNWKIPAGKLSWSKNYVWYVGVNDGLDEVTYSSRFSTAVPQPPVTSGLAQNTDGHEFDPSDGNYTTDDTDADVEVVGPSLEIDRSYNSLDPRTDSAFGAGWSTVADMQAAEVKDGAGQIASVVVTYPGGEQVAFGRNGDGTFVPPLGRYARLQPVSGGGYTLTDKDYTVYTLTQATGRAGVRAISRITDFAGRAETFAYDGSSRLTKITNTSSQRSLTLTWATPSGASAPHVATVTTDPATPGDASTAQLWNYGYSGDQLTKVCPPSGTSACATYGYTTGNHYRTTVLDADPFAYWRLGETSGTQARDSVENNQGRYNGTYRGVTLGSSSVLAGSTQKTATFNGTTSYVEMPSAPGATPSYMTVSLWFRTTQKGGVLFYYGDKPLSAADPVGTTTKNTPAVYVGTDGKLRGCLAMSPGCMSTTVSKTAVDDGKWHNAVLTGVATSQTLYLDGAAQGSLSGAINDWVQPYISLGAGVNTDGWPAMNASDKLGHFAGQLAEVAVYAEPLDPTVITAQYQAATRPAGLLNKVTAPSGKVQSSVVYGTTDDLVQQATDADGGTWKLNPATVTGSSQVYRSAVMGSAPAGYWRLDDTLGAPQAANELHTGFGTYNTVTQGVAGPFGSGDATAAQFDGTTSYAEVPYGVWHGKKDRAVELWFRTTKPGALVTDQDGALTDAAPGSHSGVLYVGSDGRLRGHWYSGGGSGGADVGSAKTVTDNAWHHAVLSATGDTQTLYLDGAKQATHAGAAKDENNRHTYIGAGALKDWKNAPADVSRFTGAIAEVAVYAQGLSEDEVQQHWSAYKASSGVAPVRTVRLTDPRGRTLTYAYDAEMGNRLLAVTDTNGARTTYGYDTAGFQRTVTDANGNRSVTGHDIRGNTVSQTDCQDTAAGKCATEYYTYFPDATTAFPPMDPRNDLPLTERDARSSGPADNTYLTSYTYDAAGNVTSVTTPPVAGQPAGRTATTTYTTAATPAAEGGTAKAPAGLMETVTTPGGRKTTYRYSAGGDLASVTDANGAVKKFTYDALGRKLTETEVTEDRPDGLTTTFTYDKNDQVATETGPPVTNRVTGAAHQARTTTSFDLDGNVVTQSVTDLTGGDAPRTTTMTYDGHNHLESRTDPGGDTTSFGYDDYGNKVRETDPAGNVNTYTFDGEGRPLTTNLLDYTGDPADPSEPSTLVQESRAYDPAGRLASITDAMGWVTAYTYTDDGLSASVTRQDPASGKSFTEQSNTYDMAGNLTKQVTNDGRTTTTFAVDAADRTTSTVIDPAGANRTSTVSYDPDDNPVSETEHDPATGDTATTDTTYDNLGNVTGFTTHDGTTAPVARYRLDETSGSTLTDSSGGNRNGVYGSAAGHGTERGGSAVLAGKADAWAGTEGPAADTGGSFTAAAWVKLGSTATNLTALGQDGDYHSGFYLGYLQTANRWAVRFPTRDDSSGGLTQQQVTSTAAPATNQWTHLATSYDATTGKIALYVDGVLQGTDDRTSVWSATGGLQIGRAKYKGAYVDAWNGAIDDVQVYGEALTAAEVAGVKGGTLPAAGSAVRATTWKLDQRGLPLAMTDPNGNTTDYGYDEAGQQATVTEPAVQAERGGTAPVTVRPVSMTGYNTFGETTEVSDPLGNVTVTAYDAEGQETSTTSPEYTAPGAGTPVRATSWNEYNKLGQVTAEVDPLGNRTGYTYTQLGDLASVTEPGGGTTRYTYSANGDQLSAVRPDGARQETTYDYLGRPLTDTDIVRQPVRRAYTSINEYDAPGGELSRTVSPTGVTQSYTYNALGETTGVTDGAGNTSAFTYDMDGQVRTATDPDGTSTRNSYDGFGRLVATSDLDATGKVLRTARAEYDRAGNAVATTDYRNHTTRLTYDASGLVTKVAEPVSATESITTTYGYDAGGNRTRFTDGRGNPFLTTYNSWGLPESLIEPSTPAHPDLADRTFTNVYDAAGRMRQQRAPGGVTVDHEYDAKSRLTRQTGRGAEVETLDHTYAYDADDRVTAVAGAGEDKDTFSYDDRGLLLSATGPSGDSSFAYDGDGAMTSRTDASGTSSYGYDTAGRLKTVKDGITGTQATYAYDVNNKVTSVDYGPGKAKRTFSYDALEQITGDRLTSASGKQVSSLTYGWDENGNMTSKKTAGVAGASDNTYTYDWSDRITSWNNGSATEVYGYDASGNRTRVGGDTYTYDARNRLTSDGHSNYAYTARGTLSSVTAEDGTQTALRSDAFNRVITEGDRTYTYDGLDRLLDAKSAQDGGASLHTFRYSGAGNDVASDGSTSYSRDADGGLLGVRTAVSSVLALTDVHDDVIGQFTADGEALTGSASYSPFGKVLNSQNLLGQLGYQSGWTDPETAKVNMAARWYSPETGQFNSRDSVGLDPVPDSIEANRYAYANDNPMTGTDPTGHWFGFVKKAFKKVARKVKKAVKSAYHKVKKAVKKAAKVVRKAAKRIKHAVKRAVRKVYRAVRKTVRYVSDSVRRVKRYVKRTYHRVKRYAHKVVKHVKRAVRKVAKAVKHVAKKVVKAAKKVGRAVKKAAKATANFVKQHASTIASVAVGVAVFAGCTALTAGAGAIACGALAGAAANGVGYLMSDGPKTLGGFAMAAGVGAVTGALGGAAGGAASGAVGRLLAGAGGRVATGAAMGAAGGGAEGAVGYGVSCVASEEGCSVGGAAKATAIGAATGGIFGAAASKFGPKSKSQRSDDASPDTPRGCPASRTPHSFTGLTGVLMANGTVKPISRVKAGDTVLTAEPGSKKKEKHKVKAVIVTKTDKEYVDVVVSTKAGPRTIQTTRHHQFYEVIRNSWTQATDLAPGRRLQNADGTPTPVLDIRRYTAHRVTYDLSIEGLHTYHVLAGATPVLVHNCGEADDDLLDFADDALSMSPGSRPNVATKVTSAKGGHVRLSYATDTRSGAMPPQTARAVANSGHHGGCGEIGCAIQLEKAGIPLEGATFQSVKIGGGGRGNSFPIEDHGELIAPCPACQRFLPLIGGRG